MIHLENKLDAWLAFMCTADPEDIWVIIKQYPEFKEIYKQVYRICQNMEELDQLKRMYEKLLQRVEELQNLTRHNLF